MTKEEQKIVNRWLPEKWADIIADEMDVSPTYVRMVKQGARQNANIEECIIKLAEINKVKLQNERSIRLERLSNLRKKDFTK